MWFFIFCLGSKYFEYDTELRIKLRKENLINSVVCLFAINENNHKTFLENTYI